LIATGLHCSVSTWKEDAWGSISLRSAAEWKGSGRGVSPFHLSPGCIRGVGSVCVGCLLVGVGALFVVCFALIAPGFFARQLSGAIELLFLQTTDVWMTVRASSAHGMSSKKEMMNPGDGFALK